MKATKGKSGKNIGAENVVRFEKFIRERNIAADWAQYVSHRGSQLIRNKIFIACGFSRGVLVQNPIIRCMLETIERDLAVKGILKKTGDGDCNYINSSELDREEFVCACIERLEKYEGDMKSVREMLTEYCKVTDRFDHEARSLIQTPATQTKSIKRSRRVGK